MGRVGQVGRVAHTGLITILTVVALVCVAAAPDAPPDLDAWVARAMKTFEVPGIGLAVVKDNAVVVSKGYGVRRLGEPAPVDSKTLFGIASNTKIFTATALGMLVDEKKIEWDAPVIRYLPGFAMYDPFVTRELTVRDLLVHRSGLGLGAGDLLWWPESTYTRKDIAHRLRFIAPATSFRSAYAYDNVLYLVAGEVIETVSGQPWETFVADRILKPVGMTGSNVRHSAAGSGDDVAATHARVDGKVRPIRPFASDNTNPAGGINASADDMAKWMCVQLSGGMLPDGTRLFSADTARQLTTIVTPLPIQDPPPELPQLKPNFSGYALGLGVRDYRGHKVLLHTGGLPGYVSRVLMVPDIHFGVTVLTNQESGEAFDSIAYRVLDHYLGVPAFDWIDAFRKAHERNEADTDAAEKKAAAARNSASRPSLPLAQYAGTYRDAWYGDIQIKQDNGKLTMTFSHTPALVGDLEHWQYDTFVARWKDRELRADAFVSFALKPDGSIDRASMAAVSPATDFSFDFQDLLLKPVGAEARKP
ncbi:MAG TPA: serine hydrolase [Vicinamibacterales bacterium]|jgi:CubicO group peptidase (beta-lactamase class C family)